VPFDLSNVMFIATANTLDTIPGPLRDRMEVIEIAGYTEEEKLQIAKRYLVPRQIERNGLKRKQISIHDRALRAVIRDYTREAGVRNLEREIGTICRKVARQVAEGAVEGRASVDEARARELLGPQRYFSETKRRTRDPGVATGLAWTPVGGDVLFVEVGSMPGTGKLSLTGQLGDVMRESAQAALSWVRANTDGSLPEDWFARHDLHIHVPSGAIPKDGPSAGVTMVTALVSMLTGRPVRDDVAMTGEVTLHGEVLPIGGLKEKALAAQRLGSARSSPRAQRPGRRGDPRTAARAARLPLHRAGRGGPRHCARAFAGRIRLERSATRGKSRMAAKSKAAKASAGTAVAGASPYVQRLVQDAELRDNLRTAYESGRSAYGRLSNGKAPAKVLLDDKKLHRDLQNAADSLRTASDALRKVRRRRSARAASAGSCCWRSWAAASLSGPARTCATRRSTCSSEPRRSSTTRRPPPRGAGSDGTAGTPSG
jgi:hypothetical protein